MPRKKLGDGSTERVQLVITDAEIEAIEAWRYSKRVPSKSEAIRRLCQTGLAFDANAAVWAKEIVSVSNRIADAGAEFLERENGDKTDYKGLLMRNLAHLMFLSKQVNELGTSIIEQAKFARQMQVAENLEKAIERSARVVPALEEIASNLENPE